MKPPHFSPEQIRELGLPCYETVAHADWTDRNQHVNIRYFAVVFDDDTPLSLIELSREIPSSRPLK